MSIGVGLYKMLVGCGCRIRHNPQYLIARDSFDHILYLYLSVIDVK